MSDAPSAPAMLSPAPGARAAKLCGIWSIIASVTCVGIPIGVALAIVALVKQAKAKGMAKENPDFYEQPTNTGLVTGITGLAMPVVVLPLIGITFAIVLPGLLSPPVRARDKAATANLVDRTGDLVGQYDRLRETNTPLEQIPPALEAWLQQNGSMDRNPWNHNRLAPAYTFHIEVISGMDREGLGEMAATKAGILGQPIWVIELPRDGQPGYLSGAVRVKDSTGGNPRVKTVELN